MDLSLLLVVLYMALLGAGLGTLTGLAPGLHVNTLALVLVASGPVLLPALGDAAVLLGAEREAAPLFMVAIIASAAVAHSILDFLPSLFLGAPEEDTVMSILPGHRMLLEGRGLEAVRCSAYGGLVGAALAVVMCLPLSLVLGPPLNLFPLLDLATPFLIAAALVALILSERGREVTAKVVVRRAVRTAEVISLSRPVPVDGQDAVLSGTVERGPAGEAWLRTGTGRWRLVGARVPRGTVRVEGRWRVRRSARRERGLAILFLLLSGALGLTCTEARLPLSGAFEGLGHSIMFPLLTGLFGLPSLISSLGRASIPPQEVAAEGADDLRSGLRGTLSGALVGWFPGISSTTGVILASSLGRGKGGLEDAGRSYLTMVSAVGTSSTVLGLLALALAFKGRSGAMLAAKEVLGADGAAAICPPSPWFPLLLLAVLVSAAVSYRTAVVLGARLARSAAGTDLRTLNRAIIVLLVALAAVFCGLPGLIVLAVSTLMGTLPPRLAIGRVHLTGCLILPSLLNFTGLDVSLLSVL
ncbi:MAG: tripartite tricarboxylate transporter permease [Methanomassiliicoccus sp.]|nr:tripartite tricarboxylate transporter permease [Methanomassiliicoccus sp.]